MGIDSYHINSVFQARRQAVQMQAQLTLTAAPPSGARGNHADRVNLFASPDQLSS